MAAPRACSFKALRNLQKGATRGLHMTGVHASPKAIDPTHKTTYIPWGLHDLRNECRKRTITATGTKHELIDRLAAHDSLQSRAFSIAMRRIAKQQNSKTISGPAETPSTRHFNTSRANKTLHDSSTIDFAYLPKLFEGDFVPQPAAIRVPILPHILSDDAEAVMDRHPHLDAAAGGYQDTEGGTSIMQPQISTVDEKDGGTLSHMSDLGDGHTTEMSVEMLAELSNTLGNNARKVTDMVKDKDESTIRQIWSGFLDDVFGAQKGAKA